MDERIGIEHWDNDIYKGKPMYSAKKLFERHFMNDKSRREWPGFEPGPQG
jgi:hypothetical protein